MEPDEEWRNVHSHSGLLEVSNLGRVRSLDSERPGSGTKPERQKRRGQVLKPFVANTGYPTIAPKFGATRKKLLVHRLVAMAFVPGHFNGATVNHIDGDKLNNAASNLEWVTRAENTAHQWRIGLVDIRGDKHPSTKLADADVPKIRRRLASGETQSALAREFGVSDTLIWCILNGRKRQSA